MKRFYCAVCALAITISAGSALALEKMDAKAKSDMTGQAGVTLTFDNVTQDISLTGAGWYDSDGIGTTVGGTGAAAGMVYASLASDITMTLDGAVQIDAGTGGANIPTSVSGSYVALTFDNLATTITALDVTLWLTDTKTFTSANAKVLGEAIVSNMTITMGGKVFISAH